MTAEKQTIQICGNVVFPLEVGRPAWISEDNGGYRRTSNVQNFEQISPTEIRFETRNTFYVLHLLSATSSGLGGVSGMKAINIHWDVDYDEDMELLPTEVELPAGMTDEEEICDYLSELTGFCHQGFDLSSEPCAEGHAKETKADRFRRVAEARVNKIIKMIRLLGNCSQAETYQHTSDQVEQIFTVLQQELDLAKERFSDAVKHKKRFSLSAHKSDERTESEYPTIFLPLPDGTCLRARAVDDETFPAIDIDLLSGGEEERICFAEYNPERDNGPELCIGVYQSNQDDTVYYKPYKAERDSI